MITRFQRIEENQVALRHSWWTDYSFSKNRREPSSVTSQLVDWWLLRVDRTRSNLCFRPANTGPATYVASLWKERTTSGRKRSKSVHVQLIIIEAPFDATLVARTTCVRPRKGALVLEILLFSTLACFLRLVL
jgi:hypothetical protein